MKQIDLAKLLATALDTTADLGLVPERPPIKKLALATVLGAVLGTTAYFGLVPARPQTQWMVGNTVPDNVSPCPVVPDNDVITYR